MAQSVLITVATSAEGDEALAPLVIEALRDYLARLEAGTAGRQAEEVFTVREGLGLRVERADTQLVADYLASLQAFCKAPVVPIREVFPGLPKPV